MQTQQVSIHPEPSDVVGSTKRADAGSSPATNYPPSARQTFSVRILDPETNTDVEVRYDLDPVGNVWVATFYDSATGSALRSVPASRLVHQLAELRALLGNPPLDLLA